MELQKLCKQKQYKYSTLSPKGGQQESLWWTFKQNRKLSEIINTFHFLESMWIRTQIKRWWLKRISNYEGHALIPPTANIKHVTKLQHLKSPSEFPYNLLNFTHQNTISFGGGWKLDTQTESSRYMSTRYFIYISCFFSLSILKTEIIICEAT